MTERKASLRLRIYKAITGRNFSQSSLQQDTEFANRLGFRSYYQFQSYHNSDETGDFTAFLQSLTGPHAETLMRAFKVRRENDTQTNAGLQKSSRT